MTQNEFNRVWRLFETLFPAAAKKKSENDRAVWRVGLEPYDLRDVTDAVMDYARQSKFFPDLADITAPLPKQPSRRELEARRRDIENLKKLYEQIRRGE